LGIHGVDLLLFQTVDFADMRLHDFLQSPIIKLVQTEAGNDFKAAPQLMRRPDSRIKVLNSVSDRPFDRTVIAGIKMQEIDVFRTAPVAPEQQVLLS